LIFSGGQDTIIEARQPGKPADANADALLLGHGHNVCSIDVCPEGGWVVSGSWDSSARIWRIGKWECEVTLEGHSGSVWAVLAYDKDTVITGTRTSATCSYNCGPDTDSNIGCADQIIRVFNTSGKLLGSIQGAKDVIRALCKLPDNHPSGAQIASAGNDGIIRLWTLQGRQVAQYFGHESFIYSLATLPSGELVSSGEDRTVRVWKGDKCIQTITHPAISVWSVAACQETGDIVTGASDRVTRVFTRSKEREAAPEISQRFENAVRESSIPQQQVGQVNKEKLPGPEFLKQKSGTKDGQVQMIREDNGSVTAHTWSSSSRQWIAVGTVVDAVGSSGKKTEYLGQDYDYVFDVDIEDGKPPLKLPYNLSQNPFEAARKFIDDNELPIGYIDQVAQFITTNTQGATIGSQQPQATATESASTPQPSSSLPSSRPTVLPQTTFLSIKTANMKAIPKKIAELNAQLVEGGSKDLSLSPSEVGQVAELCSLLETTETLESSPLVEATIPLVVKVATVWPPANRLPGLDLLRLLAAASPLTAASNPDEDNVVSRVIASGIFDPPINPNNAMLGIRMFANLFETEIGRQLAASNFDEIVLQVESALSNAGNKANRNLTIAATTLYINYSVFITSKGQAAKRESFDRALVLLEHLTAIISKEKDSEAVYRGLVGLGTLVVSLGDEIKTAAKDVYELEKILGRVLDGTLRREPRIKGVIDEIRTAFR
jgi:phospholipase A-2-activating protein